MSTRSLNSTRKRFAAVARREARIKDTRTGITIDATEVFIEIDISLEDAINLIPEVVNEFADEFFEGRSLWPVDTGYSRSRFRGQGNKIVNDASYAGIVEFRAGEPALKYVERNAQRVVDGVVGRRPRNA